MPDELDSVEGLMSEARHFHDEIKADPTAHNITAEQADMLDELTTATETDLKKRIATENELKTDRAKFRASRTALSNFFRPLRQSVNKNPATDDVMRARLHLSKSETDDDDGDPLEFAPLIYVEQAGIHEQLVRFFMQNEKSTSTKKPKGVMGAKIYQKIGGEATTDLKDYTLITIDTKSPYLYKHDAANAGKIAHYICLWTTADEDLSPQSEVFSLVIT